MITLNVKTPVGKFRWIPSSDIQLKLLKRTGVPEEDAKILARRGDVTRAHLLAFAGATEVSFPPGLGEELRAGFEALIPRLLKYFEEETA